MKSALLAFLVLGIAASPVSAQAPRSPEATIFSALGTGGLVVAGVDIAQTAQAMSRHGYREANPILAPVANNALAIGTVKIAIPLLFNYGTSQLYPKHPRLALVLRIVAVGVQTSVCIWNYHQLEGR